MYYLRARDPSRVSLRPVVAERECCDDPPLCVCIVHQLLESVPNILDFAT